MYCKFCNTEVEDAQANGAYCPNCIEWVETKNISETKLTMNKYIVKVPFSGYSRGNKIFHVEATSEESAVHKVKNYRGDLISEDIVRDDRTEEREYAQCYGFVDKLLEPEDKDWFKNEDNFPCMLIVNHDSGNALVWVHYQFNGIAYDVRHNEYTLTGSTNWRRATKQEILDNIKGL